MSQEQGKVRPYPRGLNHVARLWQRVNDRTAASEHPRTLKSSTSKTKKEDLGFLELVCPEDPTVDNPRLEWSQRKDLDDRRWRSLATPILAVLIASCPYP
ncbi:hypothetical protein PIIN_11583 [Serendipita indica DSM 11827]|uniref:Uncharacterized protein n=1 Tax=Serendipita indica (strain DSM 11827) TaxID=1109443 RepID=G4U213_SERID|nr:hypothetical protein PIIN_11583 [Serendipita indica DSM 11827]